MATTVNSPSRDAFVNNLQPCAATGSFFAYAWGNSIVYYRHDSFESRRTLEGHSAKICLLVADAHNQYSVGDIIFSYDESKVAIFWDLLAGNQLVRLMIFENLTAAAWIDQRQMIFGKMALVARPPNTWMTYTTVIKVLPRASSYSSTFLIRSMSRSLQLKVQSQHYLLHVVSTASLQLGMLVINTKGAMLTWHPKATTMERYSSFARLRNSRFCIASPSQKVPLP